MTSTTTGAPEAPAGLAPGWPRPAARGGARIGALLTALLALASCSCAGKPAATFVAEAADTVPQCTCEEWTAPRRSVLRERRLDELSGLAASRLHRGVLYAHNDSGDSPHFFAISSTGQALAELILENATAVDWEDLAVGPCPAGSCVFLADFGDNRFVRTDTVVYRVAEPASAPEGAQKVPWERFAFAYPGGAHHNAEALFVHPTTARIYVITKEPLGKVSQVYRFPEPLDATRPMTLEPVAELTVPLPTDSQLTAADVHPCGNAVLLRMYNRLVELRLPAGADFETIFAQPPVEVPVAKEPQGEAVAYAWDGRSYFTSTERPVPEDVLLSEYRCR